jgi:hypothetical protein
MTVANILEGAPSDHISVHMQVDMFRAAMMNVSESSAAETDDQRLRSEPETDASLEECRGLALGMWP